jgi:alpha-tubulin suppressor-like RCC1 family protein
VSAGDDHTCGVLESGDVKCWGNNSFGQSTPPPGLRLATE